MAISFALTPLVRRLAIKCGVIDQPGGRRVHERPTPRWGGIAIYIGFVVSVFAALAMAKVRLDLPIFGIVVGGTIVAVAGLLDDKFELSAGAQLSAIVAAALVAFYMGVRIRYVTNPFELRHELIWLNFWSLPVTIIWIFGVTKAIDLMDGIDGLAAGIGAIAAGTLLVMALHTSSSSPDINRSFAIVAVLAGALLGANVGFLRYNYPPARIFMGLGAQFIGFILATASIVGAFKFATVFAVAVPMLALGIPIFDAAFVVLRRFLDRRPIHMPDKTHMHHRLLDRGLSQRQTLLVIYAMSAILSAVGLALFLNQTK